MESSFVTNLSELTPLIHQSSHCDTTPHLRAGSSLGKRGTTPGTTLGTHPATTLDTTPNTLHAQIRWAALPLPMDYNALTWAFTPRNRCEEDPGATRLATQSATQSATQLLTHLATQSVEPPSTQASTRRESQRAPRRATRLPAHGCTPALPHPSSAVNTRSLTPWWTRQNPLPPEGFISPSKPHDLPCIILPENRNAVITASPGAHFEYFWIPRPYRAHADRAALRNN